MKFGFERTNFSIFPLPAIKCGGVTSVALAGILLIILVGLTGCNQKGLSLDELNLNCKPDQLARSPVFQETTVYPNYNHRYFSSLKSASSDWKYSAAFQGDECVAVSVGSKLGFSRSNALKLAQRLIPLSQHRLVEHDDEDLVKFDTARASEHFYYEHDYSAHLFYATNSKENVMMVKTLRKRSADK